VVITFIEKQHNMILLIGSYLLLIYALNRKDENSSFDGGGTIKSCPAATGNLELNTKNRNKAIRAEWIGYGPANVDQPADFWIKIASFWKTSVNSAKGMKCSNCVAFDVSPRMRDCMKVVSDKDGDFGYCWMHHFKCHSARTCRTWAKGGAITTDEKSYEWQEKNK
jgi:hypothetical protein